MIDDIRFVCMEGAAKYWLQYIMVFAVHPSTIIYA